MDLSSLQYVNEQQFVNLAHNSVSKPELIIFFLFAVAFFWVAGGISAEKKSDMKVVKRMFIWFFIGLLIIGGLLFFLPQLSFKIGEWVTTLFVTGA